MLQRTAKEKKLQGKSIRMQHAVKVVLFVWGGRVPFVTVLQALTSK
jgi:hypothetical protein